MTNQQPPTEQWVHDTGATKRKIGDLLGWPDKRSATGVCCGIIIEINRNGLCCKVKDITAGIVK